MICIRCSYDLKALKTGGRQRASVPPLTPRRMLKKKKKKKVTSAPTLLEKNLRINTAVFAISTE